MTTLFTLSYGTDELASMSKQQVGKSGGRAKMPTQDQVSAGGVAFRRNTSRIEVAIVCVGSRKRWQLPKGIVETGESPEATAVREEAGLQTDLIAPIEVIEYWYVGNSRSGRVRFHKFVHFFLLAYQAGDVHDHDHEVREARWVAADEALSMLAFENERKVMEEARKTIAALD